MARAGLDFLRRFVGAAVSLAVLGAFVFCFSACEGMGSFGAPAERTESRTQAEEDNAVEPPKAPMEASEYIDASGGGLKFRNGTLSFPRNSVRQKTYFTLRALEDNPDDKIALKGTGYTILPSGFLFGTPALISIQYEADKLAGIKAEDLTLVRLIDGVWREVGKSKIDLDKQTVSVPITVSGTFALAQREVSRRKVNDSPQAQFDVAYMPLDDGKMRVEYDASKSADGDGYIAKYDWDFDGDGIFDFSSRESATASYVFDSIGHYTTVLKVTDNGISPKSGVATGVVEVDELFPPDSPKRLDLNITTFPPSGNVPVAVNFAASAIGGLDPYIVHWDFGKGKTSDVLNPAFRFDTPGSHKVYVYVGDQSGQEVAREVTLNIKEKLAPQFDGKPFRLSMLASREKGRAPLKIDFTLKFENAKEPVRWKFEFGDEPEGAKPQVGAGKTASHTYTQPGMYIAKIIATDANQNVDTSFLVVSVEPADTRIVAPKVRINAAERYAAREGQISAAAYRYEEDAQSFAFALHGLPHGDRAFVSWNFGDGIFSSESQPDHKYEAPGVYEVLATFGEGIQKKERRIWLPVGAAPLAAIQLPEEIKAIAPYTIAPRALATGLEGTLKYDWDFGDGSVSQDSAPANTYRSAGTYEVKVEITDGKGEKSAESKPVRVVVYPQADSYSKNLAVIMKSEGASANKVRSLFMASAENGASYEIPVTFADKFEPFVSLSAGCGYIAHKTETGFAVTDSKTGLPVFEFSPRDGKVTGAFVSKYGEDVFFNVQRESGARLAYMNSAHFGLISLTPDGSNAEVVAVSANGDTILIRHWTNGDTNSKLSVSNRSIDSGEWSVPETAIEKVQSAAVSEDGGVILVVHNDRSVFEISPRLEEPGQVTGSETMKKSLAISDDGNTAAWLEDAGGGDWNIMIARRTDLGFLAIENLSEAIEMKAKSLSLLPDGSSVAFYAINEANLVNGSVENNGTLEGIFVCNLNAEIYDVQFLLSAEPDFSSGVRTTGY